MELIYYSFIIPKRAQFFSVFKCPNDRKAALRCLEDEFGLFVNILYLEELYKKSKNQILPQLFDCILVELVYHQSPTKLSFQNRFEQHSNCLIKLFNLFIRPINSFLCQDGSNSHTKLAEKPPLATFHCQSRSLSIVPLSAIAYFPNDSYKLLIFRFNSTAKNGFISKNSPTNTEVGSEVQLMRNLKEWDYLVANNCLVRLRLRAPSNRLEEYAMPERIACLIEANNTVHPKFLHSIRGLGVVLDYYIISPLKPVNVLSDSIDIVNLLKYHNVKSKQILMSIKNVSNFRMQNSLSMKIERYKNRAFFPDEAPTESSQLTLNNVKTISECTMVWNCEVVKSANKANSILKPSHAIHTAEICANTYLRRSINASNEAGNKRILKEKSLIVNEPSQISESVGADEFGLYELLRYDYNKSLKSRINISFQLLPQKPQSLDKLLTNSITSDEPFTQSASGSKNFHYDKSQPLYRAESISSWDSYISIKSDTGQFNRQTSYEDSCDTKAHPSVGCIEIKKSPNETIKKYVRKLRKWIGYSFSNLTDSVTLNNLSIQIIKEFNQEESLCIVNEMIDLFHFSLSVCVDEIDRVEIYEPIVRQISTETLQNLTEIWAAKVFAIIVVLKYVFREAVKNILYQLVKQVLNSSREANFEDNSVTTSYGMMSIHRDITQNAIKEECYNEEIEKANVESNENDKNYSDSSKRLSVQTTNENIAVNKFEICKSYSDSNKVNDQDFLPKNSKNDPYKESLKNSKNHSIGLNDVLEVLDEDIEIELIRTLKEDDTIIELKSVNINEGEEDMTEITTTDNVNELNNNQMILKNKNPKSKFYLASTLLRNRENKLMQLIKTDQSSISAYQPNSTHCKQIESNYRNLVNNEEWLSDRSFCPNTQAEFSEEIGQQKPGGLIGSVIAVIFSVYQSFSSFLNSSDPNNDERESEH